MIAKYYVAFRDNTKWAAAVVTERDTDWGGFKRSLFQNHAVSICEDINGRFITEDEAHFICGIMNSSVAYEYILRSSDSRSYPIRPRIFIPEYNSEDELHREVVRLSRLAHDNYDNTDIIKGIIAKLDELYLIIANKNKSKFTYIQ